jgi:hypothetical protein
MDAIFSSVFVLYHLRALGRLSDGFKRVHHRHSDTLLERVLTVSALSQSSRKGPFLKIVALFYATFHRRVTVFPSTQAVAALFRIMKQIQTESCYMGCNNGNLVSKAPAIVLCRYIDEKT